MVANALRRIATAPDPASRWNTLAEEVQALTGAEMVAISLTEDTNAPQAQAFVAQIPANAPTDTPSRHLWHAEVYAQACAGSEPLAAPGAVVGSAYAHWMSLPMVWGKGPARGLVHLHGHQPFAAGTVAAATVLSLHAAALAGELSAQGALDTALGEVEHRDALVHEANHRITNNIASVAALLQMQARAQNSPEVQTKLLEAVGRVQTFGRIHESLYRSGTATHIALGEHLRGLLTEVAATAWTTDDRHPEVTVSCPPEAWLTPAVATPLSLVAVELVMNAVKHATVPGRPLHIDVTVTSDDTLVLTVADNGPGFTRQPGERRQSFGLMLVEALASQLGGGMTVDRSGDGGGAAVAISVPAPTLK